MAAAFGIHIGNGQGRIGEGAQPAPRPTQPPPNIHLERARRRNAPLLLIKPRCVLQKALDDRFGDALACAREKALDLPSLGRG